MAKYKQHFTAHFLTKIMDLITNIDEIDESTKEEYYYLYINKMEDDKSAKRIFNSIFRMKKDMRDKLARHFIKNYFKKKKFDIIKFNNSFIFVNWVS